MCVCVCCALSVHFFQIVHIGPGILNPPFVRESLCSMSRISWLMIRPANFRVQGWKCDSQKGSLLSLEGRRSNSYCFHLDFM